jgi:hypothetical protein
MNVHQNVFHQLLLVMVIVILGASSLFARPATVSANYSCFTTVCGETWRNNQYNGICLWTSYCWQGTWSATYSWQSYRLLIEEHAEWYACPPANWCYKSSWNPRLYLSPGLATSLSTGGANYDSQVNHRTWSYHSELTGTYNGNTSDGY